jgi:hypothetical protein
VVVAVAAGVGGGWLLFDRLEDEEETEAADAGWSTCTNTVHGFSIDYPPSWYTDHPAPEFTCFYFDPRRFEVPAGSDFSGTALQVSIEDAEEEDGSSDPVKFERVEDDLAVYGYRVHEGDRRFSVFTTANQGVDFAPWREIVTRAAASLRFTERGTRTVTGADVVPPQAGLPRPVARKRAAIWNAAKAGDYEAVAGLAAPDGFEYTFGGAVSGGPAAYWRRIDQTTDERPIQTLVEILELPYTFQAESKIYVWPDAFTRQAASLTLDEKERLGDAIGDEALRLYEQLGNYLGYRAGIDEDGQWVFYVAGD